MRHGRRPGSSFARSAVTAALAAAALWLSSSDAGAQYFGKNKVQYQSFDWHVYKAPHFDVYYYPESEPFLEQVVSYAESGYLYLSKALDHEIRFRVPLIYYRTHAEFEQTNVWYYGSVPESVLAFADPLEHRVLLPIDQPPDKLYQVLVHELTHIFEYSILYQDSLGRAIRGNAPGWMMEGLASHMAKDEDNLDRMIIRDAVINGSIPPITRVEGVEYLTYRYGRAAFDFVESKWGGEGIRTFLNEFRKVLLSGNVEKAIKESFGIEADEFDRLFQRYLREQYLPTLLAKAEPQDYGREVGIKLPGVMTFSPVLSPSGDLVAVLTNRYHDLDVVVLSSKDGEVIKNLTRGYTTDYEVVTTVAFQGQSDLSWSPDGDLLAFFARKENRRVLLIVNALTGKQVKLMDVKVANAASPAFSPDGKKVLFSGNLNGVVDIYEIDVQSGEVRNITNDEYYDGNPSWSADGKTILYNRRVDAYAKIFLLDYDDPSRKTQITFGQTSDIMPSFSRDGKLIYYASDMGKEGIFNVYSLDLESGEVRQYTDVVGGYFAPQDRPTDSGKTKVVASSFTGGRFRLFEVDTTKPIRVITPAERAQEVGELNPFEPPLKLTLDESEKRPYKKPKYHVEAAPTIGVGVTSDGTLFGNAAIMFTDLLGDRRFWIFLDSVANYQNTDLGYVNLKNRLEHYYRFVDFRDFLLVGTSGGYVNRVQSNAVTALSTGLAYPFNRYYRVQGEVGVSRRDILSSDLFYIDDPNTSTSNDVGFLTNAELKSNNFTLSASYIGDTLRYNEWGPYHGKRFRIAFDGAPFTSGTAGNYRNMGLDFRAYGRTTYRSLFAFRLGSLITSGDGATLFGIGGLNQLRGYEFRELIGDRALFANVEFRFPLVDDLRFPFGSIRWIRGLIFLDAGAAWTQKGFFFDREMGDANLIEALGQYGVWHNFKWYDKDQNALRDARASYGLGFNFRMGILELNWTFAKRMPFEQPSKSCRQSINSTPLIPCPGNPNFLCIDTGELASRVNECTYTKVSDNSWRSDFYIGYAF